MAEYQYANVKEPACAGWWWCFPDPKCERYERNSQGFVLQVLEDDGYFNPEDKGRLYICGALSDDYFGFSGESGSDIFGRWYGPIPNPENA